jgi:hypothetical protein
MAGEELGVVELCPGIDHMADASVNEGLDVSLGGQGGAGGDTGRNQVEVHDRGG